MSAAPSPAVPTPAAQAFATNGATRWPIVFAALIRREGTRFTDDPQDRGGATRYGLTLRFVAQCCAVDPALIKTFDLNHDGVIDTPDIRDMSILSGEQLFRAEFWERTSICSLPAPLDDAVFDQAVNDGVVPAIRLLQVAANAVKKTAAGYEPLALDGHLGGLTSACVTSIVRRGQGAALLAAYRTAARDRYVAIVAADPTQRKYLAGWLARAEGLGDV